MSPQGADLDRINKAMKALLVQQDSSLEEVFAQHPAWELVKAAPFQLPQAKRRRRSTQYLATYRCRMGLRLVRPGERAGR